MRHRAVRAQPAKEITVTTITLLRVTIYGTPRYYVEDDALAAAIEALTDTRTVGADQRAALQALGFKLEFKAADKRPR